MKEWDDGLAEEYVGRKDENPMVQIDFINQL